MSPFARNVTRPADTDDRGLDDPGSITERVEVTVPMPTSGYAPARSRSDGARLLVVALDLALREQVQALGRAQLVEVDAVSDATTALRVARAAVPDAALIDAALAPPGGAVALAHALRALPGCEDLPLAFLGGESTVERRVAAAHAGASLYLPRPLDGVAFGSAVRQLVAARRAGRPHILIADDDPDFSEALAAVLDAAGMEAECLCDPSRVLEALETSQPDLLLLDVQMPGVDGFDVCRMLRITPPWQDLPVLFLTARAGVDARMAAFHAGGDDYLVKPVVTEELLARIRVRVDRARLLRERFDRDSLTGLFLRRAFLEALEARLTEASRHGRQLSLCLLDLDRFKRINDTRGHLVGDRVLSTLGRLLATRLRTEDLRGRWGGEEFVLAFPGEGSEVIRAVVTRLMEEFREVPFQDEQGAVFHASFSAGVASFPDEASSVDELIRVADVRLYDAKQAGRSTVVATDHKARP